MKAVQDMRCDRKDMLLYAVTDRAWVGSQTLFEQVECALKGGATCVQLREKELSDDEFLREALEMKKLCQKYGVPFIINDNVKVAVACGADGIHVGQHDMQAKNVRAYVPENMILGVSTQTVEQAVLAEKNGADYLGVGAVFATATKPDADVVPLDTLKAISRAVSIPVVAIGGICRENVLRLSGMGVGGIALVSAILGCDDIERECRLLRALSEEMVSA